MKFLSELKSEFERERRKRERTPWVVLIAVDSDSILAALRLRQERLKDYHLNTKITHEKR